MNQLEPTGTSYSGAKVSLNFGVIAGGVTIIYTLLLYISGIEYLASTLWASLNFVVYIFFMVYAGIAYKKQSGGYLLYKDGLIVSFTTYAVSIFLAFMFSYILYNFIHPGLDKEIKEKIIENAVEMMQYFGAPDEAIDKQIDAMEKQDFSQTPSNLAVSYFSFCIFGFILSLIIAAFIRKKQPPFGESNNNFNT